MDFDDRLGALQPFCQEPVVALQLSMFRRQRIGRGDLGAAVDRAQRFKGPSVALATPIGQSRGIEPLTAHDRPDPSRNACRAIRFAKDAQFVLGRKRAATRTLDEFRRRGSRR